MRWDAAAGIWGGRLAASATVASTLLFDGDENSHHRARWTLAAAALKFRERLAPESAAHIVSLPSADLSEFAEAMRLAGAMGAHAQRRYVDCLFAGSVLGTWLWPRLSVDDCAILGVPRPADDQLPPTLAEARLRHARPAVLGDMRTIEVRRLRRGATETNSTTLKRWEKSRSVTHLALAHLVFRSEPVITDGAMMALPCALDRLPDYLLFAERIRTAAQACDLPGCGAMWRVPRDVIEYLGRENGNCKSELNRSALMWRIALEGIESVPEFAIDGRESEPVTREQRNAHA
jgi:hypothetical protein